MAAYNQLKALIRQYIKTNGEQDITGQILQNILIEMVNQYPSLENYLPKSGGTMTGDVNFELEKKIFIAISEGIRRGTGLNLGRDTKGGDTYVWNFFSWPNESVLAGLLGTGVFIGQGFKKDGGTSAQFLKADGSVDDTQYLPKDGGTVEGDLEVDNGQSNGAHFKIHGEKSGESDYVIDHYVDQDGLEINCRNGGDQFNVSASESYFSGDCLARNFYQTSDETMKQKMADVELSAKQIAEAPSITFIWKDKEKNINQEVGTIAQYWQNVLPEVVRKGKDDKLTLNYQALATASVISLAREVVALQKEVNELRKCLQNK